MTSHYIWINFAKIENKKKNSYFNTVTSYKYDIVATVTLLKLSQKYLVKIFFFSFGYSLLEVLIALFILSFGLLSLASAGSGALRRTHDAYLYSLAAVEAVNLQEAIQSGDSNNYYHDDWLPKLAALLPDGKGSFSASKDNSYQDSVCWTHHYNFNKQRSTTRCIELVGARVRAEVVANAGSK